MKVDLTCPESRKALAAFYRSQLLEGVMPFWLRHGMDREHGGIFTVLDRDGGLVDSDKSVWFQGRAGWMFSSLHLAGLPGADWLEAARSCVEFSRLHAHGPEGKMYFTLTREGAPLRMRRYVFSESFAAIAYAAFHRAQGDGPWAQEAGRAAERFFTHSFEPGLMPPKDEPTRPLKSLSPRMIGIATAQELRLHLGEVELCGKSCTQWISELIEEVRRDFLKPGEQALMENVAADGSLVDAAEGRLLNPGHAIECAWFILREGRLRNDAAMTELGLNILRWSWARGWDRQHGGLLYFCDLRDKPVQEYWHDMKFWWPHCEALIASAMAWRFTGLAEFAAMHRQVHEWSFAHFADAEHGEWFGYLHRDGSRSSSLKGSLWKGPFHLPRALWMLTELLAD